VAATPAGGWPDNLRPTFADLFLVGSALLAVVAVIQRFRKRRREDRKRRQLEREALLAACEALGAVLEILDEPLSTLLPDDRRKRIAVARHEMGQAARAYRTALGREAREEPLGLDIGPRHVEMPVGARRD
jgi:hypothetical protein